MTTVYRLVKLARISLWRLCCSKVTDCSFFTWKWHSDIITHVAVAPVGTDQLHLKIAHVTVPLLCPVSWLPCVCVYLRAVCVCMNECQRGRGPWLFILNRIIVLPYSLTLNEIDSLQNRFHYDTRHFKQNVSLVCESYLQSVFLTLLSLFERYHVKLSCLGLGV